MAMAEASPAESVTLTSFVSTKDAVNVYVRQLRANGAASVLAYQTDSTPADCSRLTDRRSSSPS